MSDNITLSSTDGHILSVVSTEHTLDVSVYSTNLNVFGNTVVSLHREQIDALLQFIMDYVNKA